MNLSNLPPGVSESMIPGNRPEDGAEEAFWDQLYERMGPVNDAVEELLNNEIVQHAIIQAREMGYALGLTDGHMEEQLAEAARQTAAQEAAGVYDRREGGEDAGDG